MTLADRNPNVDTVGEFMKHLFCRPYGTDPDVYMPLIPAVNYWAIISSPYRTRESIDLNSATVLLMWN
jgi:hypothetical protein